MSRLLPLGALAVAALIGGLVGCSKPVVREKPLADPLLVSKKPVEGKQGLGVSRAPTTEDVPPPPPPPTVRLLAPPVPSREGLLPSGSPHHEGRLAPAPGRRCSRPRTLRAGPRPRHGPSRPEAALVRTA